MTLDALKANRIFCTFLPCLLGNQAARRQAGRWSCGGALVQRFYHSPGSSAGLPSSPPSTFARAPSAHHREAPSFRGPPPQRQWSDTPIPASLSWTLSSVFLFPPRVSTHTAELNSSRLIALEDGDSYRHTSFLCHRFASYLPREEKEGNIGKEIAFGFAALANLLPRLCPIEQDTNDPMPSQQLLAPRCSA